MQSNAEVMKMKKRNRGYDEVDLEHRRKANKPKRKNKREWVEAD